MSSDKKLDHTRHSEVFSIDFEDDAAIIPGVTQLLNPKAMKEASEKKSRPPLPNINPPQKLEPLVVPVIEVAIATVVAITSAAKSLAECGVQFELQFEMERGVYRYTRMKAHSRESFALWQQKFYFQMKLNLQVLEVTGHFQEFEKEKNQFHADAFGLEDATHVQVVRFEQDAHKVIVLFSEKSLVNSEKMVREFLDTKNSSGSSDSGSDGDFKIELAS
jgi:hypothetical protein